MRALANGLTGPRIVGQLEQQPVSCLHGYDDGVEHGREALHTIVDGSAIA